MKRTVIFFCAIALFACEAARPSLISGPVDEDTSIEAILNASAGVLLQHGYTVQSMDANTGFLTTEWLDESSFADQVILDISRRTRVSILLDPDARILEVQLTAQKKDGDRAWRTDDLSGDEKDRLSDILASIQDRVGDRATRPVVIRAANSGDRPPRDPGAGQPGRR